VAPRRPQEGLFALREWERDGDLPAEYAHGASPPPAAAAAPARAPTAGPGVAAAGAAEPPAAAGAPAAAAGAAPAAAAAQKRGRQAEPAQPAREACLTQAHGACPRAGVPTAGTAPSGRGGPGPVCPGGGVAAARGPPPSCSGSNDPRLPVGWPPALRTGAAPCLAASQAQ